jgi:hypothetical protein
MPLRKVVSSVIVVLTAVATNPGPPCLALS